MANMLGLVTFSDLQEMAYQEISPANLQAHAEKFVDKTSIFLKRLSSLGFEGWDKVPSSQALDIHRWCHALSEQMVAHDIKAVDVCRSVAELKAEMLADIRQKEELLAGSKCLYAIGDNWNGAVKIGISNNPFYRARQLSTGSASALHVLGFQYGDERVERILHTSLRWFRLNGEWFDAKSGPVRKVFDAVERKNLVWRPKTKFSLTSTGYFNPNSCVVLADAKLFALQTFDEIEALDASIDNDLKSDAGGQNE